MTSERLAWVFSGLDLERLSKLDKDLVKKIQKKIEQPEKITAFEESQLEKIYKSKGR